MSKIKPFNDTTCFKAHQSSKKTCKNKTCRYWHNLDNKNNNCVINLVNSKDTHTLQEVGDLFNITRMRICQIEKSIIEKLRKKINLTF